MNFTLYGRIASAAMIALASAACVTGPTDGSTMGTMAEGGVTPRFDISGYALQSGVDVAIEIKDQVDGTWRPMYAGTAVSGGSPLNDKLWGWKVKDLHVFDPRFVADNGDSASIELRARHGTGPDAPTMVTYTSSGMQCLVSSVLNGTDPIKAGGDCATGNSLTLNWDYDGIDEDNESFACTSVNTVTPFASEDGHRLAVRLTPPSYPFEVRGLRYNLMGQDNGCDKTIGHRVEAFVSTGTTPPATPNILRSWTRTSTSTTELEVTEFVDLSTPLVLTQGQHLFVAIEMNYVNSNKRLCVPACTVSQSAAADDRYWWSNADATPYSWQELVEFNIFAKPRVGMIGEAL